MENKTLLSIEPDDISPNPHNPRLVFGEEGMLELKKSISKVGILVPLTVYKNEKSVPKSTYILLDGERRWRVAKELGLPTIPANVIDEPADITQNILFMFNIHHYRKEWELFPTALKLEVIINKLGSDSETALSAFTGVSRSMIRRCKILLWYPSKYRELLASRDTRISTDFFIELYPIAFRLSQEDEYDSPVELEKLIDKMIDKFLQKDAMVDVKEFREIRRSLGYYDTKGKIPEFINCLNEFLEKPGCSLDIFSSPEIEADQSRKNILKYVSYLNANLKTFDTNLLSELYIVEQLELLKDYLEEVLDKISL
ncbi:ParB/RepB/Spo0J family partition protein [Chloroflexota bacterium]